MIRDKRHKLCKWLSPNEKLLNTKTKTNQTTKSNRERRKTREKMIMKEKERFWNKNISKRRFAIESEGNESDTREYFDVKMTEKKGRKMMEKANLV